MPNLIYRARETAITWRNTGGTAAITLTSLAAGAGRQGAMYDRGAATDVARRLVWRAFMKFATAPVVGEVIEIYLKTGDGTHFDNDDGTGDAAVSAEDKLRNLKFLGVIEVDEASATPEFSASGEVEVSARQIAPVFWNRTADDFSSTAADHGFDLVPVPDEIQ